MTDETLDIKNPSIMGKMIGNCHTITRLISFSYEQPLTTKQQLQISSHTMMCGACRNYKNNSKTMSEMIAQHKKTTQEIVREEIK